MSSIPEIYLNDDEKAVAFITLFDYQIVLFIGGYHRAGTQAVLFIWKIDSNRIEMKVKMKLYQH